MRSRLTYAMFGVLATLVGMATGHLVASLLDPASSPVLAVGSQVIDLTPTPLKEWAIQHFGSNDKRVLVGSVLAGVLVLAALAGLLARDGSGTAPGSWSCWWGWRRSPRCTARPPSCPTWCLPWPRRWRVWPRCGCWSDGLPRSS